MAPTRGGNVRENAIVPTASEANAVYALDWLVIAAYGVGMIAVGYYYSRRSRTTEDYMLGGRRMDSWLVGFSLFASLLSAISYLAWPGEMIKHGPTLLLV